MGQKFIPEEPSPYYPPRARWYSGIFHLSAVIRRRLSLDRLVLPSGMSRSGSFGAFVVPGLAVVLRGPKTWGQLTASICLGLLIFYFLFLGYPAANFALGLLLSIHTTGFVYYCSPMLLSEPFHSRIGFTFASLLAILLLLYLPVRFFLQNHVLTPLSVNGHVVVVQRFLPKGIIQRGDWIAYQLEQNRVGENYHNGTVWVHANMSFGPVLAVADDRVMFSNACYFVNGIGHTNLPHMPTEGSLTVAEKHWFVWPNLAISGHGDVGEARLSEALMGLSDVSQSNFLGTPFKHWLWRRQTLP